MSPDPSVELLGRLSRAAGAPGAEHEVRTIVQEALRGIGDLRHDRLGSVLSEKAGASEEPRVVLDAHMDEVGFMVQSISSEGNLGFIPLGGWWGHTLLGQRVDVVTEGGQVPGVIGCKPPHFLSPEERTKVLPLTSMYIDVGASDPHTVEELGIQIGDTVVPHAEFGEMAVPGILSGKAFDDRAGVGVLCEALRALDGLSHPNTVIGVAAVQEEVGCRGAATASALARPDVALVLEGTPADDLPGFSERQAVLGQGPQIRFVDPTAISNRPLVRFVQAVAREQEIPVQLAVRRSGGTNAKNIQVHGAGVPTVVIGVPARYIHTHVSLIHWQDYCQAVGLVVEVVQRLDAATVASFTDFGS